jgi:CheY-specific phosphatase CheX
MSEEMSARLNDLMGKLGGEAMLDLFEAYSLQAQSTRAEAPAEDPTVGVIGFTAAKLRGNLALLIPSEVIRVTQSGSDAMDWAGELTNQYLGRLKNKLIGYGVALEISTPLVVSGLSLRLQEASGARTQRVDCDTSAGPVHALISVRIAEGFEISEESSGEPMASEGEMLLF